ncbi:MAG: HAD family hydrolase [Acidobacteriota bacterium]|nr:HAD family hydrolase [Acidobacteriota bacterium]
MTAKMDKHRAVFFDKDGTLVKDVPYNVNPDLIVLNEGAAEAVKKLKTAGFKIFVVSNQSGIARGFFEEKDLAVVWEKLNELCEIEFDGFYFCPHFLDGKIEKYSFACDCRKPEAGMILQAAREHNLDLQNSWVVGDSPKDAEAGRIAGCRTILLGDETNNSDFTAKKLKEAARIILNQVI